MNYLIKFIKALGPTTALIALLGLTGQAFDRGDVVAQNITVEYLEQLLRELKQDRLARPDDTICDIDWRKFGIIVSLSCDNGVTKSRRSVGQKHTLELSFKEFDDVDSKIESAIVINGEPRIDCNQARDNGNAFCTQASRDLYRNNIQAPWLVSAVNVCKSVFDALSIDVNVALTCKGDIDYSSIELREDHGDTLGNGNPIVYIRATKASGLPPVYRIMVVASPRDMVDDNGTGFFERFEYLVFWTYSRDGRIGVSAEVVNSFQGNRNNDLHYIRGLDLNTPEAVDTLRFIPGTSRPAQFRDRIVTSVREMTVEIRDDALQQKLGSN